MKRLFTLLLALMLLLSLTACGGNEETPSGDESKTPSTNQQQEQSPDSGEGELTPKPDNSGEKETPDNTDDDQFTEPAVETSATAQGVTVTIDKSRYQPGETIHYGWGGVTDANADGVLWGAVGLFAAGAAHDDEITYNYTEYESAEMDIENDAYNCFTAPATDGNYEVRFYWGATPSESDFVLSIPLTVDKVKSGGEEENSGSPAAGSFEGPFDDKWPDCTWPRLVPRPEFADKNQTDYSAVSLDEYFNSGFSLDVTLEQAQAYAELLKTAGYTINPKDEFADMGSTVLFTYAAEDENGNYASVGYNSLAGIAISVKKIGG